MQEEITRSTPKQLVDLQSAVEYAIKNSPFYKELLGDLISDNHPFTLEDFERIPLTVKAHLSERNMDFLSVPVDQVAEYAATSGTSGDPVSIFLTKKDLDRLAQNEHDSLKLMGGTSADVYQLLTTIDKQFMAGLAYYLGVQRLEAGMIRIGPGLPRLQWHSILTYKPTKLIAVPSFIVKLIDYAKANNIDLNSTSVDSIVCIGEPVRHADFTYNALGERITSNWNVRLFSTYASTEMATAFSECEAGRGCHVNEDLIFLEVIKEDGTIATEGEPGEIVVTPLKVEGTPLIRFATGDLAQVYYETCSCGNSSTRLGPIIGRKNQMIKFKGTTLYPKAIFDVLDQLEKIAYYKVEVKKDAFENDEVTVFIDDQSAASYSVNALAMAFKSKIRVVPEIRFLPASELRQLIFNEEKRKPEKISFQ